MIVYQKPKINFEYKLGKFCCSDFFKEEGNKVAFQFDKENGTFLMRSGRLGVNKPIWITIQYCPFCGERISILKMEKSTEDTLKELKILN